MPDFELLIGGSKFTNFTNGWVKRELDTAADSFQFQYADVRTDLRQPLPLRAGDPCVIKLRGVTLLTGYLDDVSAQYTADTLTMTARGRSKTGDLVDCSAVRKPGRWSNKTLREIVTDICQPFGISVTVDPIDGIDLPLVRFAIQPGEPAIACIQRACKQRAVWATNTVEGGLLITKAATGDRVSLAIEYGKNTLSGERFDSWLSRHSQYLIKGQVPSDDDLSGEAASQQSELIFDEGVNRYRPLLLVSTGHDRKGDLQRRAQWERNRRAGSGERMLYRVEGYGYDSAEYVGQFKQHRRDAYKLWKPNQEVRVVDPRLEIDDWYLISAVSYRWDADGNDGARTTDLTLTRKEAFSLQPYPPRKPRPSLVDGFYYNPRTIDLKQPSGQFDIYAWDPYNPVRRK